MQCVGWEGARMWGWQSELGQSYSTKCESNRYIIEMMGSFSTFFTRLVAKSFYSGFHSFLKKHPFVPSWVNMNHWTEVQSRRYWTLNLVHIIRPIPFSLFLKTSLYHGEVFAIINDKIIIYVLILSTHTVFHQKNTAFFYPASHWFIFPIIYKYFYPI